jgi:AbrB family looped-hinge helix DNA binding protein
MSDAHAVCYGTATVAERGQVVIPREAREKMNLKAGDKLMVFAKGDSILAMIKVDKVEEFINAMVENFSDIKALAKE